MPLALDDFMMCKKILPTRTDAILKHAMYYFQQKYVFKIQLFSFKLASIASKVIGSSTDFLYHLILIKAFALFGFITYLIFVVPI